MRSQVLLLIAVLSLVAGGAPPTEAAPREPRGRAAAPELSPAPVASIPFRSLAAMILVPVRINGSRELSMILDTGMSSPVVVLMNRELGNELHLEGGQPVRIGGAGNQAAPQGLLSTGITATLGGVEQPGLTTIVVDVARDSSEWVQDGIIGKSLFDRYVVDIDYERSILSLYEPESFEARGFKSVPVSLDHGYPTLAATVEVHEGRKVPVRLVVDLGAGHALALDAGLDRRLAPSAPTLPSIIGMGIRGEVEGRVGRVPALHVGPFTLRGIVSTFESDSGGIACAGQGSGASGNLGSRILRRFRVVVDYPHGRILLAPRPDFDRPFEQNMAGLVLRLQRDGSLLVAGVLAGSSASEAGMARGDRIVAIEGRTLDPARPVDTSEMFEDEGATLHLTVDRGGARSERSVTLRRMI